MEVTAFSSVFFSPTESTKEIVSKIAAEFHGEKNEYDITTLMNSDMAPSEFPQNELVIFGAPVYGGRISSVAAERFRNISGDGTPAIIVVTYGNREYEDALLELYDIVTQNGFTVISAAAFIAEHSIMRKVAAGRPDKDDIRKIKSFAVRSANKLSELQPSQPPSTLAIPGNRPYRSYSGISLKPRATRKCVDCGICAHQCPVAAISIDEPSQTDRDICISCMRCIKFCPIHARKLGGFKHMIAEKAFYNLYQHRKEPSLFL